MKQMLNVKISIDENIELMTPVQSVRLHSLHNRSKSMIYDVNFDVNEVSSPENEKNKRKMINSSLTNDR